MKYQIRIYLKKGNWEFRKLLAMNGFAIYKENRWTKTIEAVDDTEVEIIDFKSKTRIIQEIENDELSADEFYDCFCNTDDDRLAKLIYDIIGENLEKIYGYSVKYAVSESWRTK